MYPYAIGLDVGITSVGWSAVALDPSEKPCGIINMGSRIFDAAEHPITGASLALPRREARSMRRRLRRHRHRNERIRNLLINKEIVSREKLSSLFEGNLEDIYALRVRALDELVSSEEMARILIHISQRRGFRSNRKSGASKEDGALLSAVNANQARMKEKGFRSVAELFLLGKDYQQHKRNKGGEYISTVSRDMVEDEVRLIFAAQRKLGASFASEDIENAYLEILLSQRSFDEGPGGDSPYGGSQIAKMVGKCTLEPEEFRAAKATYSFEYFNLLERINHIRIIDNSSTRPLTQEERNAIVALAHKTESLNYSKIRAALSLPETSLFNMVRYELADSSVDEIEKKEKFCYLKSYHQMRKAFEKTAKGHFSQITKEHRNAIGQALSLYKTESRIREYLEKFGLSSADIDTAVSIGSFSKFGHLSVKACDKIIPFLEQGMNYNDACAAAGYDYKAHGTNEKTHLLHVSEDDFADITSPVARRAISQTVKVINAIIRERGCSPTFINIELAREMSKDFSERKKAEKSMLDNRAANERLMERLRTEYHCSNPTGQDLIKLKLFEEQGGVCAYSLKQMSLEHLFDNNYAEIDHIIPYSISFDDSYNNKVLVLAKENQEKKNRLPMQYLTGKKRDDFVVWVNSCVRNFKKRKNLLKESITEEDRNQFKERNLQDTKTMSRFLLNYIADNLEFAPSLKGRKKRVTAANGTVTSYMRKRWGITKLRENGDLHHAVDALVIACTTDGMIQQVSRYAQWRECEYQMGETGSYAIDDRTGEVLREFPYPWPMFRRELECRLSSNPAVTVPDAHIPFYLDHDIPLTPLFVSRAPRRKVTGPAHKETVKSPVALDDGYVVVKKPLTALKLDKDGEIQNYYEAAKNSDRLLYDALKAQLLKHNGKAEKAFSEPFYKPKADGTPGPLVNKVKLYEPTTLNVSVLQDKGVADHDSMVRIDVFYVEGDGYYFVPIYIADTLKDELPNKACVAHKPYSEWKEMKDDDFIFSLYPNDLVQITHKKGFTLTVTKKESTLTATCDRKTELMYYIGANISTGALSFRTHDDSYGIGSLGIKTLESFEKYTVDVLGTYHKVGKEVRQTFHRKRG